MCANLCPRGKRARAAVVKFEPTEADMVSVREWYAVLNVDWGKEEWRAMLAQCSPEELDVMEEASKGGTLESKGIAILAEFQSYKTTMDRPSTTEPTRPTKRPAPQTNQPTP